MTSSLDLQLVLTTITQGLVDGLNAAFARIWLFGPGDLCGSCYKAKDCSTRDRCLHLEASAGIYTGLNGEYRRIPLGALKIGRIAQGLGPMCTNDILGDERLPNKQWMQENKLRSFAGYPLIFRGEVQGVIAMFGLDPMSEAEFHRLGLFANQAAVAMKNAQLFSEVERMKNRLEAENLYLQEEIKTQHNFEEVIGGSRAIKALLHKVEQVAPTDATVLILGETGTGKELIARAIHNLSPRRSRALVRVNCGSIHPNLIESELFGHEKGAFTGAMSLRMGRFELADGGTILLDEVGELAPEAQTKLLRVLQEREFERVGSSRSTKVDVRVIAATNRNLHAAVKVGAFRADLLYRLNIFPIELPPLRDRPEDVPLLVQYCVTKFARKLGRRLDGVSKDAMERLQRYPWPGNIRELENVIERAAILSEGPLLHIDSSLLAPLMDQQSPGTLQDIERSHILHNLETASWVIDGMAGAAVRLGLHPNTLRSRMQKLGIKRPLRPS